MSTKKRIDLGEYVVLINYDKDDGSLEITVLDELGDAIDTMVITNDDEDDKTLDINLN